MIADSTEHPAKSRHRLIWVTAGLLIYGIIGFGLPLNLPAGLLLELDPSKVKIGLGIFACIALLWLTEALPLAITALLIPILASASGLMDVKTSLTGYADPLIFLFFGGFAMASALSCQGLDHWLANRIVRTGKGDFLRVSFLIFGATAILSMWVSNTATTAMMLPLALGIIGHLPESARTSRNSTYLLLGVAYSASIGGLGTIVGSPPNGVAAAQLDIPFVEWMKFGIPSVLILLPLMIWIIRLACRPESLAIGEISTLDFKLNRHRILTLGIFITTAACWVFSGSLSRWVGVTASFDTIIALGAVLALTICGVVNWKQIDAGTDWGVLILFGGGITLSHILGQSGASLLMARVFSGWIAGYPVPLVIAASICFIIFLSELTSNTALAALMVPVFISISGELGIAAKPLVLPVALAASCAFMLPVGTPPNGIVFATGRVPQREMIRVGLLLNLAFVAAISLLAQVLF
jgi:sodium-dependent dicarboxylate transporter 2/3/5